MVVDGGAADDEEVLGIELGGDGECVRDGGGTMDGLICSWVRGEDDVMAVGEGFIV